MPKRKRNGDYEKLLSKFQKLERKIRRRCRSRSSSSKECCETGSGDDNKDVENNVARLLTDGDVCIEPVISTQGNETAIPAIMSALDSTADVGDSTIITIDTVTPSTSSVVETEQVENESAETALASEILEILGEDPTVSNTYGPEIHKDLALRLQHSAVEGLTKESRKELSDKYLIASNCKLVDAPGLNAEIKAAISDLIAKRDKAIEMRQKQLATAISSLALAINTIITKKNPDSGLIKILMDTERILCDCQHTDSVTRRNFILSSLKRDMKDQLQTTKTDNLLFGQNLSETIRNAKAINKSGADLKTPAAKPQNNSFKHATNKKQPSSSASTSRNLNWKGPYPIRKPPNPPKTKELPPNKYRQPNLSRPLPQQRTRDRH